MDQAEQLRNIVKKNQQSTRKARIFTVTSGKGGVGKSLVTSLSAIAMARKGYKTAILDADITGPSIPKIFGIHSQATGTEQGMIPKATLANGIKLMSTNLLLEHDTDPLQHGIFFPGRHTVKQDRLDPAGSADSQAQEEHQPVPLRDAHGNAQQEAGGAYGGKYHPPPQDGRRPLMDRRHAHSLWKMICWRR